MRGQLAWNAASVKGRQGFVHFILTAKYGLDPVPDLDSGLEPKFSNVGTGTAKNR